ncbi:metalloendopeptidase [Coemansia sp. RSA 2705]|nr:metalloendopeptidase [Coemansia sp. RSA 2705]
MIPLGQLRQLPLWHLAARARPHVRWLSNYNRPAYRRFSSNGRPPFWQSRGFWYAAGTAGTGGLVYYELHIDESPTGRRRFIDISPAEEEKLGQAAYLQTMAQYRGQIVPRNAPADAFVRRVAHRVIGAAGLEGDWEVHVIHSPEKNAFVLPGRKIFVFSGLLPLAASEDGLATVLAHEIAHQYARHSAEKLSQAKVLSLLYMLVSLFVDPSLAQLGRSMTSLLLELPNSRQCEQEADEIGLNFMAMACYDPHQAVGLWQRMRQAEGVTPPQLLNTHPSSASRIANIQKWIPQAQMKREAANCPNPELTRTFFSRLGSGVAPF